MVVISSVISTWSLARIAGSSPSVLPKPCKGLFSNFYHVIESESDDDDDDDDGDDNQFRFNDMSIHEGQNGIFTLALKRLKLGCLSPHAQHHVVKRSYGGDCGESVYIALKVGVSLNKADNLA